MDFIYNNAKFKFRRRELRGKHTDAEAVLWDKLRERQLSGMKFFRQYSIGPCVLDFYCPQIRVAIELDGGQHAGTEQKMYDRDRTEYLEANDIKVLRFWNNDVICNTSVVLETIKREISEGVSCVSPSLKVREGVREVS